MTDDERNESEVRSVRQVIADQGAITPLVKAYLVGGDVGGSRQLEPEEQADQPFAAAGALTPDYDPEMLCMLFEHSNSLRQNVDAYATNIDGFGHRIEPAIDLDADGIDDRLQGALERKLEGKREITKQDVGELKRKLREAIEDERERLELFFESCCPDESFVSMRKRTRQDKETGGNGYWEVLRTPDGELSQFVYMPSFTMRLMPLDEKVVDVEEEVRVGLLQWKKRKLKKRFRRFLQIVEEKKVYFKEFGDPRVVSNLSGKSYPNAQALLDVESDAQPATEVYHWNVHNTRSPYGVPRWIGNLLSVIGSRQSEEINFLYFENKSVPPLAVLVSGGRLSKDSVRYLQDFLNNHIKGKRNWHRVLILEAEPAVGGVVGQASNEASSRMKIELRPLLGAQHNDALFQKYDATNRDKVGEAFRIPRLLRGDMRDFNRSTAFAALNFAEQQVFEPERQDFDWVMNRKFLPALGARYHKFVSLAPVTRDPVAMSAMIKDLTNASVLTPEESRELAGDVFNRVFKRMRAIWTRQPVQFTLAGMDFTGDRAEESQAPAAGNPPAQKRGALSEVARTLIGLRSEMRKAAEDHDREEFLRAHGEANADEDPEVVRVPEETFRKFFDEDTDAA